MGPARIQSTSIGMTRGSRTTAARTAAWRRVTFGAPTIRSPDRRPKRGNRCLRDEDRWGWKSYVGRSRRVRRFLRAHAQEQRERSKRQAGRPRIPMTSFSCQSFGCTSSNLWVGCVGFGTDVNQHSGERGRPAARGKLGGRDVESPTWRPRIPRAGRAASPAAFRLRAEQTARLALTARDSTPV